MVRARSRDFLLTICGVLLLGIALVTIIVNLIVKVDKLSENERRRKVLGNVKVTAEKVAIRGQGNFNKKGPMYDKLVISDFKVKVRTQGDKVQYIYRLCNENMEDVKVQDISMSRISCMNHKGKEMDCGNIEINKYFMTDDNKIVEDSLFKSNTCLNTVVSVEYKGEDLEEDLLVDIEQFSFNIDVIK